MIGRQMNRHHVELTRWAMGFMDLKPGDTVLDLGSGAGMAAAQLAAAVDGGKVIGIDYSDDMIAAAREYNAEAIADRRVEIIKGDIASLPFEHESVDKAFSIESFYYWPDYPTTIGGIYAVIKPGGRFAVVLEWSKESTNIKTISKLAETMNCPLHSGDEISEMMSGCGFGAIRQEFRRDKNWLFVSGVKPVLSDA
jgi:ubiquinone/menaquinone biosynthesis C-methylase UbiE